MALVEGCSNLGVFSFFRSFARYRTGFSVIHPMQTNMCGIDWNPLIENIMRIFQCPKNLINEIFKILNLVDKLQN